MSNTTKQNQSQTAPAIELHFEELTPNERLLVEALYLDGRPIRTIKELMEECRWHLGRKGGRVRGCNRVRNTLRRLVRSNWVTHAEKVGDGKYRLSPQAINRLRYLIQSATKLEPTPEPAPVTTTEETVVA